MRVNKRSKILLAPGESEIERLREIEENERKKGLERWKKEQGKGWEGNIESYRQRA